MESIASKYSQTIANLLPTLSERVTQLSAQPALQKVKDNNAEFMSKVKLWESLTELKRKNKNWF